MILLRLIKYGKKNSGVQVGVHIFRYSGLFLFTQKYKKLLLGKFNGFLRQTTHSDLSVFI
jgi:hypothetical protein